MFGVRLSVYPPTALVGGGVFGGVGGCWFPIGVDLIVRAVAIEQVLMCFERDEPAEFDESCSGIGDGAWGDPEDLGDPLSLGATINPVPPSTLPSPTPPTVLVPEQ